MASSVNKGDFVSWTTTKGRYVGQVSSVVSEGNIAVATREGGSETVEATPEKPVARVRVYLRQGDGSYSRSDRDVPVRVAMLNVIKEPRIKAVSQGVEKTLREKAENHNADVGNAKTKRTTTRTLIAVFERGIGAYRSNPQSVRPTVNSAEQWAFARVNSFLYALRNGRFRRGKHDTDLLPKGHPHSTKSKSIEKGPACRQSNETYEECVDRKIPELISEDGMDRDQAIATAYSICMNECGSKNSDPGSNLQEKRTDFPKRGDDQKVSLRNSQYPTFPLAYAEKLKNEWPEIWSKGGNILGNTQFARLKKVHSQMGEAKTPTDEKAIRLREAWMARHLKDHLLAGVVAQIKWLGIGSRGISHMKKVINDEKKRLNDKK